MDIVSVVVGRNSIVFTVPPKDDSFAVPCTEVKPGGNELVLRIVLGNVVSAKPVPNTMTPMDNAIMTSLYPV